MPGLIGPLRLRGFRRCGEVRVEILPVRVRQHADLSIKREPFGTKRGPELDQLILDACQIGDLFNERPDQERLCRGGRQQRARAPPEQSFICLVDDAGGKLIALLGVIVGPTCFEQTAETPPNLQFESGICILGRRASARSLRFLRASRVALVITSSIRSGLKVLVPGSGCISKMMLPSSGKPSISRLSFSGSRFGSRLQYATDKKALSNPADALASRIIATVGASPSSTLSSSSSSRNSLMRRSSSWRDLRDAARTMSFSRRTEPGTGA